MKRYQVTVEEIVDKPAVSPVDAPGTIITWQEAQRRVDAGLAVDYHAGDEQWDLINFLRPASWPDDHYRIPLQPAEAVTMTADDALTNYQLKDCLSEARQCAAGRLARCIQLVRERGGLERQLASALASQKSAEAALEVERERTDALLRILSIATSKAAHIEDKARHNRAWLAVQYGEVTKVETAGKESGG